MDVDQGEHKKSDRVDMDINMDGYTESSEDTQKLSEDRNTFQEVCHAPTEPEDLTNEQEKLWKSILESSQYPNTDTKNDREIWDDLLKLSRLPRLNSASETQGGEKHSSASLKEVDSVIAQDARIQFQM